MNFKGDFHPRGQFSEAIQFSMTFIRNFRNSNYIDDGFAFSTPIRVVCGNSVTTKTVQLIGGMTLYRHYELRLTALYSRANNISREIL